MREKNVLSGKRENFSLLLPYLFLVGMFEEREEVESSSEKCRLFSKKIAKIVERKFKSIRLSTRKHKVFLSFDIIYTHTGWRADDIKFCKLHPIIRSKFAALTFHRSQASIVSLRKLWKNRKESKKKSFLWLTRGCTKLNFFFSIWILWLDHRHIAPSRPLNSHPIYRLMLIFYVLLKHRKVASMNNKKQTNFYFRYIYLFVSGDPKKVNFIFGELLRHRLISSSRCVLKSILRPPLKTRINRKVFQLLDAFSFTQQ